MFQPRPSLPAASPSAVSLPIPPEDAPATPLAAPEALTPEALTPEALTPEASRAVAALFGEGRVVAHRPCFARIFGGAACGVLLSQFWFWTGTPTVQERTGGWFWKPQREITEETGLSRAETETARRRLRAQGILEEERRGLPATLHFRLDMGAVLRRLWAHLQALPAPPEAGMPQTETRGSRTLVRIAPAGKFAGIAQTTSESISERTQEKTQTRARPLPPAAFADKTGGRSVERSILREIALRKAVGAAIGGPAISVTAISVAQSAVNRGGVARLKAALDAAAGAAPRPSPAPGRAPPRRP